jgi:hypothetical protein
VLNYAAQPLEHVSAREEANTLHLEMAIRAVDCLARPRGRCPAPCLLLLTSRLVFGAFSELSSVEAVLYLDVSTDHALIEPLRPFRSPNILGRAPPPPP